MKRNIIAFRISLALLFATLTVLLVLAAGSGETKGQGVPEFTMSITGSNPIILSHEIPGNNTTFEITNPSHHTEEIEWWYYNISGIDIHPEPSSVVLGPGESESINLTFQLNGSEEKEVMEFAIYGRIIEIEGQPYYGGNKKKVELYLITNMDYYVDASASSGGNGSYDNPYNEIQNAIDNAAEGSAIFVFGGTYYENVVVSKTVKLLGYSAETPTIYGEMKADVVRITANWCNVSGFNVTGNGSQYGITLISSTNNNITNNMVNSGIFIEGNSSEHWNTHNITSSNTVNGKPVYYYKNSSNVRVSSSAGQLIFANCKGMIVENLSMSNGSTGVICGYSSNITISNNSFVNYSHGVYFYKTSFSMLINNTCMHNGEGGFFEDSNKNTLLNNTITENEIGICLTGSSRDNNAHYNTIYSNTNYGIKTLSNNPINATNNWWGDPTGPYHPTTNPEGKGDNITENVLFSPWAASSDFDCYRFIAHIEEISPNPAVEGHEITLKGSGESKGEIVRYVWCSSLDQEIYNGTNATVTLTILSAGNHTISLKILDEYGVWSEEVSEILEVLKDTDKDGVIDEDDAFPNDPAASKDIDGDGYPDEWNEGKTEKDSTTGLKLDEFPDDPGKWEKEEDGGGDDGPGFGLVVLAGAFGVVWHIKRKRN